MCQQKNPSENGKYYTVPVKYTFKDRDTRNTVDAALREFCDIQSGTPYHFSLRECIKAVTQIYKERHPDDFIRVSVDSSGLQLKVSRREGARGGKGTWFNCGAPIPLPACALDTGMRFLPEDLNISKELNLQGRFSNRTNSQSEMDSSASPIRAPTSPGRSTNEGAS